MPQTPDDIAADRAWLRRVSPRYLMLGILAGLAACLMVALVVALAFFRQSTPLVTEAALAAAIAQWDANGPASYDVTIRLGGTQQGEIKIEVRDDQVTNMTRDGVQPRQRRTWDYWSIPNQFDMIRQDLDSAQSPQRPFGVSSPDQVVLRAEFDEKYGYPHFYQRTVSGARYDVEWRNERFTPR